MDTVTYPDDRVEEFLSDHFIPVKVIVKDSTNLADEYGATWTPTLLVGDEMGKPHFRIEGYFSPEDFTGYMALGLGRYWFDRDDFEKAIHYWQQVSERHQGSEIGAQGLYWLGVARYKSTQDVNQLKSTWSTLLQQYADSEWAKRANVPKTS